MERGPAQHTTERGSIITGAEEVSMTMQKNDKELARKLKAQRKQRLKLEKRKAKQASQSDKGAQQ